MSGITFMCALVTARDVAKSRHFYETLLGQKVKFDFGQNVTFEGDFAIHEEAHFLSLLGADAAQSGGGAGNNFELYFETDDMEAILHKLESEHIEFIHGLREQPWGQRVMRLYDPDRHIVEIGEPMSAVISRLHRAGMTADDIRGKTSMPEDIIKKVIEAD
jgi:catechol 2,3-dioxygenase-like lactoylglutathione lyase family enzyme